MQKREEFLLKYKKDMDTSAQKEIDESRYNREAGDLQGSPIQDKQTGSIYAFTKRGEKKELAPANEDYQKQLAYEREAERQKNEASLRMADANINQSNASAEASRAMATSRANPSTRETPEDKAAQKQFEHVLRIASDPHFISKVQGNSDTPPTDEELIAKASKFVETASKAVGANKPKPLTPEEVDAKVKEATDKATKLRALGVSEAEVEAALKAELQKLGLQPK